MGKKNKNKPTVIKNSKPEIVENEKTVFNSLASLVEGLSYGNPFGSNQISDVETLFRNNRWYMLSNMRQILSQLYVEHGIIQTLVDQPVQDAFRSGYEIKTDQLSPDEITELHKSNERDETNNVIEQAFKWNRLYGGAGIIIMTGQDPTTPLEPIKEGDPVDFKAVDMWELFYDKQNAHGEFGEDFDVNVGKEEHLYNYYGIQIHSSRVLILKGKEAPSFVRPRLRGWGMSELERMVRSLNSYLKNQDLVFELLDEAKVDVYKMEGYNSALASNAGTESVKERIQTANMIKNYQNAITMDKMDEYDQKQMSFAGLGDMLTQIRQGICSDLKFPMTKLFGLSASGFNSGEDEIENYNSMVEGEVRSKAKHILVKVNELKCMSMFGIIPDDLEIDFNPLRILSSEQEENVKTQSANRIMSLFNSGLITAQEAREAINKDNLISVSIEEDQDVYDTRINTEVTI